MMGSASPMGESASLVANPNGLANVEHLKDINLAFIYFPCFPVFPRGYPGSKAGIHPARRP